MSAAPTLDRCYAAYGVLIGFRVDDVGLFDALEQDAIRLHLPYGWRPIEIHESGADVSIQYELRSGAHLASRRYRLYADGALIAESDALTDVVRWKRLLIALGLVTLASAALILALHPTFLFVSVAEVLHGVTAGIMTPAIAAVSLGIVGRRAL